MSPLLTTLASPDGSRVLSSHYSCRPYPHIRRKLCCSVLSCFSRALWFDRGLCWPWGHMALAHLPRLMALPWYAGVCVWFGLCYALSRVTLAFSAFCSPLPPCPTPASLLPAWTGSYQQQKPISCENLAGVLLASLAYQKGGLGPLWKLSGR